MKRNKTLITERNDTWLLSRYRRDMNDRLRYGIRYPWPVWFRKKHFTLCRGTDYLCRTAAMAQITWRAAKRNKVRVSIETAKDERSLIVTVID